MTEKTVLILGAGASKPYCFPTGSELLREVLHGLGSRPTEGLRGWLEQASFEDRKITRFVKDLAASGTKSVDRFLEYRADDYLDIGKAAIAAALIPKESPKGLLPSSTRWYQEFFDRMIDVLIDDGGESPISIVTYNYDRSLEYWLFSALHGRFPARCRVKPRRAIDKLEITHVHGSLGCLRWQKKCPKRTREYAAKPSPENIRIAARCIKVPHEEKQIEEMFEQARGLLSRADHIYFLGFGYDEKNLERLQLQHTAIHAKSIKGTRVGLTETEKNRAEEYIVEKLKLAGKETRPEVDLSHKGDVLSLIRQDPHLQQFC